MFSLRSTIIILAILIIPFALRYKYGSNLEPFPAVILPSGAYKTTVSDDEFTVRYKEIHAQKKDCSWILLDAHQILYPLPVQYHDRIFSRSFGLKDQEIKINGRLMILLKQMNILKSRKTSEEDKKEVQLWLREAIGMQGYETEAVKIISKEQKISVSNKEVIDESNINEQFIQLDQ